MKQWTAVLERQMHINVHLKTMPNKVIINHRLSDVSLNATVLENDLACIKN